MVTNYKMRLSQALECVNAWRSFIESSTPKCFLLWELNESSRVGIRHRMNFSVWFRVMRTRGHLETGMGREGRGADVSHISLHVSGAWRTQLL